MRTVERGGEYLRVAEPEWDDPLDGRFAGERGGRWNPPSSFPVVYLTRSLAVARANVYHRLEGHPYGPEDLDLQTGPVVVSTDVPRARHVDVVTARGCRSNGLPATYPRDATGEIVGREVCRPVGLAAWNAGLPGIACRSAAPTAPADGEELAWFERHGLQLRARTTRRFGEWFW